MRIARHQARWIIALGALAVAGCAQGDSVFARRTTLGSLKTGMSHLEFENNQLKSQMAELKTINRDVEDRLVQEESANGELKARLDNARTLLSDRGHFGNVSDKVTDSSIDPAPTEPRKTLPAGRSTKPKRKPPFARISGGIEPLPSGDNEPPLELPPAPNNRIDSDDQSRLGDPTKWLPISRGVMESSTLRR